MSVNAAQARAVPTHHYPTRHKEKMAAQQQAVQQAVAPVATHRAAARAPSPTKDTIAPATTPDLGSFKVPQRTDLESIDDSSSDDSSVNSSPRAKPDLPVDIGKKAPEKTLSFGHPFLSKTPKGTKFSMGPFQIGKSLNELFTVFSEECTRGDNPFHTKLFDQSLSPEDWSQFLVNTSEIMEVIDQCASRKEGVSLKYSGALNKQGQADRDLAILKKLGVRTASSSSETVEALIDHLKKEPKFGDADAFLFYGMGLNHGQKMDAAVTEMAASKDKWNIEFKPNLFSFGDSDHLQNLGNRYFESLDNHLEKMSSAELLEQQIHLTETFRLYSAVLKSIGSKEEAPVEQQKTKSMMGRLSSGIGTGIAAVWNRIPTIVPNRVAFWRST